MKFQNKLKKDGPAAIMVFLVALPLCLGIALASGADAISGIITGIIGGIVIGSISGSNVSISGPTAGLTLVVVSSLETLGNFETFLLALCFAGLIQIVLGIMRAGFLSNFFPSSVIRGMLAAIGIILILKQLPHALGYDFDYEGDFNFFENRDHNTFTDIVHSVLQPNLSAIAICLVSMAMMIAWDSKKENFHPFLKLVPGALIAVVSGICINAILRSVSEQWALGEEHLVNLPEGLLKKPILDLFVHPDFSAINNPQVYIVAFTIAIIASIETLLSVEASDRLDHKQRITPLNRELIAQGVGNTILGLVGGIPATAVIVRSSANVVAGAVSKWSAILQGILLMVSVLTIARWLNLIPLSSLAAILLLVGYKLTNPALYKTMFERGTNQYIPFLITILAIIFSDLLIGIAIGLLVGIGFMVFSNFRSAVHVTKRNNHYLIRLRNNVTFLNKSILRKEFLNIPPYAEVIIDGTNAIYIDHDIIETIELFLNSASEKGIRVEVKKTQSSANSWSRT